MVQRVDFHVSASLLSRPSKCRTCGRAIVFHRHPSTMRTMPLDVASKVADGDGFRLESHFPHCSAAAVHRKRDSGKPKASRSAPPARGETQATREIRELYGR